MRKGQGASPVAAPAAPPAAADVQQPDGRPLPPPASDSAPSPGSMADLLEELPVLKAKAGSGVYELLVQEIRAARAQQRLTAKVLEGLQRNVTSLASALASTRTQYELSDEALERRVEALAQRHLQRTAGEMAALRAAMRAAAKREHAALSLLAMLTAVLVLSRANFSTEWPKARRAAVALAVANGVVGLVLHWQGGAVLLPAAEQPLNS